MNYKEISEVFKILSNAKRLEIINLLSNGELCACELQKKFNVTQPTLSYDMKLLKDVHLIKERVDGRSHYYCLDEKNIKIINDVFYNLTKTNKE